MTVLVTVTGRCVCLAGRRCRRVVRVPDAVVIPGRLYGPGVPLLMYSGDVAQRRGARVHRHFWSQEPPKRFGPDVEGWVCGEVAPLLDSVDSRALVIGKSLATNAAALAAERSLPAVWLTPLLNVPWVVAALGRASAPLLLVGGTADPAWDGALARSLSPHVFELDGADHGMYVAGPLTDSITLLGQVVTAVEEFLDMIGWAR